MLLLPLLMAQNTIDLYYDGRIYFITHKNTATLAWDAVPNSTHYKLDEVWFDQQIKYYLGSTPLTTYPIKKRRCGHFFYLVKACNYDVNGNELCSDSASSLNVDNASVDGVKKMWLIYWGLTPPSDPVIE
jgi:hypothetical protein